MVPDLTLETIYFGVPTDFKMEFDLCGCCSVRFLSAAANDTHSFLISLKRSVSRSRVIITIGGFSDDVFLPSVFAKATGVPLQKIDKEMFGVKEKGEISLPKNAIPLVTVKGGLAGFVLESGDQSVIMLHEDPKKRHEVVSTLICPYLVLLAEQKHATGNIAAVEAVEPDQPIPQEEQEAENPPSLEPDRNADQPADPPSQDIEQLHEPDDQSDKPLQAEPTQIAPIQTTLPEPSVVTITEPVSPPKDEPENTVRLQPPITDKAGNNTVTYTVMNEPKSDFPGGSILPVPADFIPDDWDPESDSHKPHHRLLKAAIAILLVVLVLFGSYFGYQRLYMPMQCSSVYQNVTSLFGQKTKQGLPSGALSKFGRLYLMNHDLIGWLNLPNTEINYPVVSTENSSATYYNSHLFDGSLNHYGTIYTSGAITKDSFTRNIVIYGKDFSDDKMLSELTKYKKLDFYRSAPVITFDTLYGENNWKIFSVFSFSGTSPAVYNRAAFFDDTDFAGFANTLQSVSVIKTSVDLKETDELVTLVAKGAGTTTVVAARKVRAGESSLVDVTGSTVKTDSGISSATASNASKGTKGVSSLIDLGEMTNTDKGTRYEQTDPGQSENEIASNTAGIKPKPIVTSSAPASSGDKVSSNSTSSVSSAGTSHASSKNNSSKASSSGTSQSSKVSSSNTSSTPPVDLSKLPTLTVTNASVSPKVKISGNAVDIIAKVIEAEMGSGFNIEALKAQAVASYSWMLCNGAASGKAPEVPMKTAGARATEAAKAVAGVCAVYNGTIAQTYYYAISAGRSVNCDDIWSASLPYLKSVDSSVDKNASGYQTIRTYSAANVKKWIFDQTGIDLGGITDKTKWFKASYDTNGLYVKTITIGSTSYKGTYLRDSVFTLARVGASNLLRSSAYTITYNKADDTFTFTVKGYGHGVGMSQVGANAYANSGWTYDQILKHYYTGITLGTYFIEK